MADEAEELRRRELVKKNAPLGGLFDQAGSALRLPLRVGPIRGEAPSVRNDASEAAADAMERNPAKRETQHKRILRELLSRPAMGYTRNELAKVTGILLQSVCARVSEMGKGTKTKAGRGWIDESEVIMRDGGAALYITAKGRAYLATDTEAAA